MKYLILALLTAFSLPVMAASINLNSSRSNVVEDKDGDNPVANSTVNKGKPTKEQCATTKDAKVTAQCKQLGIAIGDPGQPSGRFRTR
jgi:hypothetical protein